MSLADEDPTFTTVRMREGYDMAEVDEFLDQARAALGFDPPLMRSDDVERKRFSPVRMRNGYEMGQVDDHLDRLAAELRRREPAADPSGPDLHQSVVRQQSSGRPGLALLTIVAVVLVAVLILAR